MSTEFSLATPRLGIHLDQVDDAHELVLGTDRQLQQDRDSVQTLFNGFDAVVERSAGAVQLIDVADTRHAVLSGLTPHSHRLRLDARHTVEYGNSTVEDTQGTLHLDGEVHVPGGVNDVDLGVMPEGGGRGGGNGNAALLLLLHPVHGGGAVVDLADLVGLAGVVKDALGRRRLAGIDVGHDADVANLAQVSFGHCV